MWLVVLETVTVLALGIAGAWIALYPIKRARWKRIALVFFLCCGLLSAGLTVWKGYQSNVAEQARSNQLTKIDEQTKQPPIIKVEPTPVQVVTVAAPLRESPKPPEPEIELGSAHLRSIGNDKYELFVVLGNRTDSTAQAAISFLEVFWDGEREHVTPIPVASPWQFTKDRGIGLKHIVTLDRLPRLSWRITADYMAGKKKKTYRFGASPFTDLSDVNIDQNSTEFEFMP